MNCHICRNKSEVLFDTKVLLKYTVSYFKCRHCGFIQTQEPYWLQEAYTNAISLLDVGLVERNITLSETTGAIIKNYFNCSAAFLDYAGGYGLFVRLMRDKGFNYYRQDLYCENLFAKCFDYTDISHPSKFELLTAFEVFEHLEDPMAEISKMFEYADSILFSTELQPDIEIKSPESWGYFIPESGQHIAFYNLPSLEIIAEANNCFLYSNNKNLHIFTRKKLSTNPFIPSNILSKRIKHKIKNLLTNGSEPLHSLRQQDYNLILNKIKNNS